MSHQAPGHIPINRPTIGGCEIQGRNSLNTPTRPIPSHLRSVFFTIQLAVSRHGMAVLPGHTQANSARSGIHLVVEEVYKRTV